MTIDELQKITVVENLKPIQKIWTKEFDYPEDVFLHEIIGIFKGCDIICKITVNEESVEMPLMSGATENIYIEEQDNKFNVSLQIHIKENAIISQISMFFVTMYALPIKIPDIEIINHPRHDFSIGIDFTDALIIALGVEECISKEVQIRNPDGTIINIIKPSINFQWQDDLLLCRLTAGYPCYVRIKYKTEEREVDWSDWLKFTPKRKMSL